MALNAEVAPEQAAAPVPAIPAIPHAARGLDTGVDDHPMDATALTAIAANDVALGRRYGHGPARVSLRLAGVPVNRTVVTVYVEGGGDIAGAYLDGKSLAAEDTGGELRPDRLPEIVGHACSAICRIFW